jgi:cob(I)alamin adenosyltransferase
MKLYTRTGDAGQTSLFDGTRVQKDDIRVAAYGDVDELNAVLGWCSCAAEDAALRERLAQIQADLFVVGAELATPPDTPAAGRIPLCRPEHAARLEGWIDEACAGTPPLRTFVLPGGTELASRLHMARTVSRRAERSVIHLGHENKIRSEVVVYLNRLSDLLFAWARWANHQAGCPETPWVPNR